LLRFGQTAVAKVWCEVALVALLAFAIAGGCDWFKAPVEANIPPDTAIVTCPSSVDVLAGDDVTIEWSGSDGDGTVVRFEWTLDGSPVEETTETSMLIEDVAEGEHTFTVAAVDDDGDVDESPAVCVFTASEAGGLVDRVVLAELLTTEDCSNCWMAEAALDTLLHRLGPDELCVIAYHYQGGPFQDPFANDDALARCGYYYDRIGWHWATTFPLTIFDGGRHVHGAVSVNGTIANYEFEIDLRKDIGSPLTVGVTGDVSGASGSVAVRIRVRDVLPLGPNVVRIVVTEDNIDFEEHHYDFLARKVLEDETLTISAVGDSTLVERTFTIEPEWDTDNLGVVAFVQDDSTGEILQSGQLVIE